MEKLKKIIRISGLVIMVILASVGLGLVGGVPIPSSSRSKEPIEINIELEESNDEEQEITELNMIE